MSRMSDLAMQLFEAVEGGDGVPAGHGGWYHAGGRILDTSGDVFAGGPRDNLFVRADVKGPFATWDGAAADMRAIDA